MDLAKLNIFLNRAHLHGYASTGEKGERILTDGSKEFEYKEKEFLSRDRYFGFNPFIGEEIIFQNGKAIWGMNYYGEVMSEDIPAKEIYQFLKEALRKTTEDKPFRGPDDFKRDNFRYINKLKGTVKKFIGEETIFYKDQIVYKLNYHGGLVVLK